MKGTRRNRAPASIWRNPIHLLAFGLGTGASPWAPGTVGTLLGIPLYWLMSGLPMWMYLALLVILFGLGAWACEITSRDIGVHDHPGIVFDEVVGYLLTMLAVPAGIVTILAGFVLFRVFDVFKPWPVRLVDRSVGGGLGIMLDDVVAGLYALALLWMLILLFPELMNAALL